MHAKPSKEGTVGHFLTEKGYITTKIMALAFLYLNLIYAMFDLFSLFFSPQAKNYQPNTYDN